VWQGHDGKKENTERLTLPSPEEQGFSGFNVDGKLGRLGSGLKTFSEKRIFRRLYSIYKCGQNSKKQRETANAGIGSFNKHL